MERNKSINFFLCLAIVFIANSCKTQEFRNDSPAQIFSQVIPTDVNLYKYYPSRKISNSEKYFAIPKKKIDNYSFGEILIEHNKKKTSLNSYLKSSETVALLVLYNDTLRYEEYFSSNGAKYDSLSVFTSFSIAKSIVSILFGIALEEKAINSIEDPIVKYIPELKSIKGAEKIKLFHLLQMTSGITFNEDAGTSSDLMNLYQVNDIFTFLDHIKLSENPGTQFYYKSIDTQLLGIVISRAVNKTLSEYLEEKIWKPSGMQYPATWNLDKIGGIERAYGCINARAIDFARFGQLILQHGTANNTQIIDSAYINSLYSKNSENEPSSFYRYHWWQIGKLIGDQKKDIAAIGILGQFVYIDPEKNIVIVKFSNKQTDYLSDYSALRTISNYFNK